MKLKTHLFVFIVLSITLTVMESHAQQLLRAEQAQAAFQTKDYEKSATLYFEAAKNGDGRPQTVYQAARAAALIGKTDDAFRMLERAIFRGYADVESLKNEADLVALQSDARWSPIITKAEAKQIEQQAAPAKFKELITLAAVKLKEEQIGGKQQVTSKQIKARVDPRMELLAIIFRLAGNQEYNQASLKAYRNYIDARFAGFREHPAVRYAAQLREQRGVGYDAVMSMAVHLTDLPKIKARTSFENNATLEKRWQAAEALEFSRLVNDFAQKTDFKKFVRESEPLYQLSAQRMQKLIDKEVDLKWFESFFGERAQSDFILSVGLQLGGGNYGVKFQMPKKPEELYAIIGAWGVDKEDIPEFNKNYLSTIIHEFNHSFVNPTVAKHQSTFQTAGELVYSRVADKMQLQGYSQWKTMIDESLVRASVARYILAKKGEKAAKREIAEQFGRSFIWMDDLVSLLGEYEKSRAQYPTFESFLPRIAAYFNELPAQMAAKFERIEMMRPKIVSITPGNGDQQVNPNVTEIRIVFDRPMSRKSFATMLGKSGREHFPEVTESVFDDTGKVFIMKVKLKPNWNYEFGLNSENIAGFISEDGFGLKPFQVQFKTTP